MEAIVEAMKRGEYGGNLVILANLVIVVDRFAET
jgi:hypothetical protein